MKKLLSTFALISFLCLNFLGMTSNSFANEVTSVKAADAVTLVADATPAEKPAEVKKDEPPPPVPNKGDTSWMIVATLLVTLMTIPGLALFYGGLVRSKNMLSVLMQTFVIFSLCGVLWAIYGYSVAFSGGTDIQGGMFHQVFGGLSKIFLSGITPDSTAATFSKGVVIPEYIFVAFQLTFAAITPALIIGAFAERMKFSAILLFIGLWFTFAYLPMAHMVWYWDGPDAITSAKTLETVTNNAGWLWAKGALDFAGGTVVHINAGIAALVAALVLGKRIGYGKEAMPPHSLTLTMVGASLLWVGWFGFNAGSNLEATGVAALAFINTMLATAMATLSWMAFEWILKSKPSMLGAASGAVAGLVAITPACGFVGPMGALIIGLGVSPLCLFFVSKVKSAFGYDDTLDVFGVHGIGGMFGAIMTGIFVSPALGGTGVYDYVANKVGEFDMHAQVVSQLWAVGTAIVVSATVSYVALKLIDMTIGLRVKPDAEREGLDIAEHGEQAYHK
jgi:Amt family ammonium transporter